MKVTLRTADATHPATLPHAGADVVHVAIACPACRKRAPLVVRGTGNHIGGHDYYQAEAVAQCCGAVVGQLRAKVSTLFGLEEDEAVLIHGRARVYW